MPCLLEVYLVSGVDGLHGDAALILKLTGLALYNGVELAAAAQPAVRERSHCETTRHAQKGNTVTTACKKMVMPRMAMTANASPARLWTAQVGMVEEQKHHWDKILCKMGLIL
jgi:hypothetical protein